jgi:hypothetical protein
MEEHSATPALLEFPQLQRLAMFSPPMQGLIADYLAYLRARHYAPSVQGGTIRALKSFAALVPEARQACLSQDLTQTTPTDIDTWIEASFRHQLAPGTIATRLRVVQGFFRFLRDQGTIAQSPIRHPRHHILVGFPVGLNIEKLSPGASWENFAIKGYSRRSWENALCKFNTFASSTERQEG